MTKQQAARIAQLAAAEGEYTALVAAASAAALAAETSVGYERASGRANALEQIALRLAAQRRALEATAARAA